MDWVVWTIGGIILLGIIVGIYRGAVRIAVSIVTVVITAFVAFYATPYAAQIIEEKTPLDESIKSYVVNSMADAVDALLYPEEEGTGLTKERVEKILKAAGVDEEELKACDITVDDIVNGDVKKEDLKKMGISEKVLVGKKDSSEAIAEELMENTEIPRDVQIQAIETAELPEVFKELLRENNNIDIYGELGVETFAQYVGTYLARLMIHIASFLALFLLVTIILRAIIFALNVVNEIPVFGIVNRLAGGAAGIVCSLVVVWFFMILVTLFYTTEIGKQLYDTILGNPYTAIIYENNPLLKISIKF